jgi:hypothetical protein
MHVPTFVCMNKMYAGFIFVMQIRCMLTVIAARQCIHVSQCVSGLVQGACSL